MNWRMNTRIKSWTKKTIDWLKGKVKLIVNVINESCHNTFLPNILMYGKSFTSSLYCSTFNFATPETYDRLDLLNQSHGEDILHDFNNLPFMKFKIPLNQVQLSSNILCLRIKSWVTFNVPWTHKRPLVNPFWRYQLDMGSQRW